MPGGPERDQKGREEVQSAACSRELSLDLARWVSLVTLITVICVAVGGNLPKGCHKENRI